MGIAQGVRRQFLIHLVRRLAGDLRQTLCERSRREVAHRQVHALFDQGAQGRAVRVRRGRLLRPGIGKLHPFGERLAVFRPHRVVEGKRRGPVPDDNDDGVIAFRQVVPVLVAPEDVVGKPDRVVELVRRPRVEDDAVFAGQLIEPVVARVTRRFERAGSGLG